MRTITIAALAAGLFLTSGCASYNRAWQWQNYPGALLKNHCSQYASAVVKDLRSKGIESYYVAYSWKTYDQFGPITDKHAVAIFKQDGNWKLVDNEAVNPITLHGKTLLSMVQWRTPQATAIITNYFDLPPIPVGKGVGNNEGWKQRDFSNPNVKMVSLMTD
jgi:hypothetical protein